MSFKLGDRVRETTTTTGTGTINLDGTLSGMRTFVEGVGSGNKTYYCITNGTDWEVGIGTVTAGSPDTLARTTVVASSAGETSKVNFPEGSKDVFCTMIANRTISKDNGIEPGTTAVVGLPFYEDPDTGFYQAAANQFTAVAGGVPVVTFQNNKIVFLQKGCFPIGTAAAPSIAFNGDENTGFYSPAADQIGAAVAGVLALLIQTSGISVQQALAVVGSVTAGGNIAANNGNITSTSTTGAIFASIVETLTIGMAATDITIGSSSGITRVRNNFSVGGSTTVQNLTVNGVAVQGNVPTLSNHLVNKTYADLKLALTGGSLSGFLTLHADPTNAYHPATKQYADNLINSRGVSTGIVAIWPKYGSIPAGWLILNGQAISRTVYAALFAFFGTTYGAGDGVNTFNLPDWRAMFLRGHDDGRGIDIGRIFGSYQADAVGNHSHKHGSIHHDFKDGGAADGQGVFCDWASRNEEWTGQPVGAIENLVKNLAIHFIVKA